MTEEEKIAEILRLASVREEAAMDVLWIREGQRSRITEDQAVARRDEAHNAFERFVRLQFSIHQVENK
jgi:hypothetical protein